MVAASLLAELEIVDRRELGVLDTRLTALEVFQVDFSNLDAGMPHEPGEAVDLAATFQPGAREGMAELVRRHGNISDARRLFDALQNLLDAPGCERLAGDAREERHDGVVRDGAMLVDVLPDELGRGRADADLALFAPFAEDLDVALMDVIERDAAQFADPHPRIEQDQHQDVVTKAERRTKVTNAEERVQMLMGEGDDHAAWLGGLMQPERWIAPDHFFVH